MKIDREQLGWLGALLLASAALTFFTVYDQIFHRTGIQFLMDDQLERHQLVLSGQAIDPWQYRVFGELVVEAAIRGMRAVGLENPILVAFGTVRVLQNFSLFLASALYWRTLGISRPLTLLGLSVLAWGISYSGYGSDLAFSSYFDVTFFVLAGWLIIKRKEIWVLPIIGLAALNRETSALIPAMLLGAAIWGGDEPGQRFRLRLALAGLGFLLFVTEYTALRLILGPRPMMQPYGVEVGLDLLLFNLADLRTYLFFVAFLGITPLIAFLGWKRWPSDLRAFFWAIVPIWTAVHLLAGAVFEARLFFVPHVLILLPAALIAVQPGRLTLSRVEDAN